MEIALLNDDAMWPRDEGRIRDGVQTSLFHFTGPYFYRRVIRGEEEEKSTDDNDKRFTDVLDRERDR